MTVKNKKLLWIMVSVLCAFLAAPIHVLVKLALDETDPYFYNYFRYLLVFALCLPLLLFVKHKTARISQYGAHVMYSAITMALSVTFYTLATYESKASLVSILSLLAPVFFLVISGRVVGEKFTKKEVYGTGLSLFGALVVVTFPLLSHGLLSSTAYPTASLYMILGTLSYAASLVFMRTANEKGAPLTVIITVQALISMAISYLLYVSVGDTNKSQITDSLLLTAGYPALVVAVLVRMLDTLVYEKVGSVVVGLTSYLNVVLGVILAAILLSETVSIATIIGGVFIVVGIIVAEFSTKHHKLAHHKYRHH